MVGQALKEVAAKRYGDQGFKKCGVSVAIIDGSEDNEINIKDLEDYEVESDDDDDPFVSS